jgi:uncharacterized RDD family membrane protein YckC
MLKRFYTVRNNDKNVICPLSCLSKNHFLSKEWSKKAQAPCIILVGLKMVFSKTAPKMASKRIKRTLFKISTFTGPLDVFYFFKIFL